MKYPHVAARIFNTPLLIHPQKLDAIIAGLGPRLLGVLQGDLRAEGADAIAPADALAPELFSTRRGERVREAGWPGYQIVEGVAVISANGALVHRTKLDAESNLLLGYNDMAMAVEHAMGNDAVHAVLMVWDSPGGEVQGAFEFADRMGALGGKPLVSIADGMAASAAYLGGSAKGKPYVTATGYAGSIGVVMRHVDFSRMLANEGIAVTHVFAGAHKIDGNPYQVLPESVRKDFQAEIDTLYGMFVATVAKNTGLSAEQVRGTEARVFMGQAAVEAGLAAGVTTTDALITELSGQRARTYPAGTARQATSHQGASMSGTQAAAAGQASANAPAITQADLDKARAEGHAAGKAEGLKEGQEQGAKAERERVSGILAHKEADGRGQLAVQCIQQGLSVEQAGSLLAAAPKQAGGSTFAAVMAATPNPQVKAGETQDVDLDNPQAVGAMWDRVMGVGSKAKTH